MKFDELKAAAGKATPDPNDPTLVRLEPPVEVSHGIYHVHADVLDETNGTVHIFEFSKWLFISDLRLGR